MAEPQARRQPPAPPAAPMRDKIREAIARAPVRGKNDLAPYLDSLEAQARAQGKVTALEVEPGLQLIFEHTRDTEQSARFAERMLRVQAELQAAAPR